jgi:hypothetical protein
MLPHVGQHDTPEHNLRRPPPAAGSEYLARPVLLGHPRDHGLKAGPACLDLLGGLVFGHRRVLAGVYCVDGVGRLPLKFERRLTTQRTGPPVDELQSEWGQTALADALGIDVPGDPGPPRDGAPAGGRGVPVA